MSTEAWIDVLQTKQERLLPGIRYVWDAPFFYVPIGSSLKYIQDAMQDFVARMDAQALSKHRTLRCPGMK